MFLQVDTIADTIDETIADVIGNDDRSLNIGNRAVGQLWPFWLALIAGALRGAGAYRLIGSEDT